MPGRPFCAPGLYYLCNGSISKEIRTLIRCTSCINLSYFESHLNSKAMQIRLIRTAPALPSIPPFDWRNFFKSLRRLLENWR